MDLRTIPHLDPLTRRWDTFCTISSRGFELNVSLPIQRNKKTSSTPTHSEFMRQFIQYTFGFLFYHPRRLPIVYHLIPTPSQVISAFGLRLDLLDGSDPQGLSGARGKHKSKSLAVVCQLNP